MRKNLSRSRLIFPLSLLVGVHLLKKQKLQLSSKMRPEKEYVVLAMVAMMSV